MKFFRDASDMKIRRRGKCLLLRMAHVVGVEEMYIKCELSKVDVVKIMYNAIICMLDTQ